MTDETRQTPGEMMERQRKIAQIRRLLEQEIERRRARGELDEAGEAAGAPPASGPAFCPRRLCRRAGACRPPASGGCASHPAEAMRLEIAERIRALRLAGRP